MSQQFSVSGAILHSVALAVTMYGKTALNSQPIEAWMNTRYAGQYEFLTPQSVLITQATLVAALLSDVFPSIHAFKLLKRSLIVLALPLTLAVSLIYWTMILFMPAMMLQVDPAMAAYQQLELYILPLKIDLALHASPALALLADFFLHEDTYSKSITHGIAPFVVAAFSTWYGTFVEFAAPYNNGVFPYPFLTENPFKVRVGIYIGAAILALLTFWTANVIHSRTGRLLSNSIAKRT